jgi:hypothetical protein
MLDYEALSLLDSPDVDKGRQTRAAIFVAAEAALVLVGVAAAPRQVYLAAAAPTAARWASAATPR